MSLQSEFRAIEWTDSGLRLLDQRLLPAREEYLLLTDAPSVAQAIRDLVVRGAPAIGITAAYAVVLSVREHQQAMPADWRAAVERDIRTLAAARPTAVNLVWALQRMQAALEVSGEQPLVPLLDTARAIYEADIHANRRMGDAGASLINQGDSVLTYCNTGSLAAVDWGTALGVVRMAHEQAPLPRRH